MNAQQNRVSGFVDIRQALANVAMSFRKEAERCEFVREIRYPKDRFSRLSALRQFYKLADEEIFEAGSEEWGIDPYEVDWIQVFTPIEYALWHDIRGAGCVFYPQYPVGRYFVDFANPVAKVAIECDGAKWHMDKEKDAERQREIESAGWVVYRITGSDCVTDFDEETMEISAARNFIDEIAFMYDVTRGGRRITNRRLEVSL
jgi:very-short-patch-repair endonuclease